MTPSEPSSTESAGLPRGIPGQHEARLQCWAWWAVALLALAKLVLVSHDEIQTFMADDHGYAFSAAEWYWGHAYGAYTHSRQPTYPLFLSACAVLGLPVRLAIEGVWIGACVIVAKALRALSVSSVLSIVAFTLMLLHPWTLWMFNRFIVDTLYAPAFGVFVIASAVSLAQSSWRPALRWGALAGSAGAVAANTRQESVLVIGSMVVVVALALLLAQLRQTGSRTLFLRIVCAAIIPFAMTQVATQAIRVVNRATIGAAVTHDLELPGFKSLYRALLEIKPDNPQLTLPIPRDVRQRAFEASPSFARLAEALENDPGVLNYSKANQEATGVEGEYGAWWVWALRHAAWVMNRYQWRSAAELDAFYAQAAAELRQAMREGTLPRRRVLLSFVPPEWGQLADALPKSAASTWRSLFHADYHGEDLQSADVATQAMFDGVAVRRRSLVDLAEGRAVKGHLWHGAANAARLIRIEKTLSGVANSETATLFALLAIGLVTALIYIKQRVVTDGCWVAIVMLLTAGAARFTLVTVLDATGGRAQPRYLLAMVPIMVPLGVLGAHATIGAIVRWTCHRGEYPKEQHE